MGARAKVFVTLALAGTCGVLALPSAASAARSGVTIHNLIGDGFKGYVFSPKPRQCARDRTVRVFRQKGKKQNPKRDIKVAKTAPARKAAGGKYRWSAAPHRPRPGDYYAQIRATTGCQADRSKTFRISARPRTRLITSYITPTTRSAGFYYIAKGGLAPYRFRCKLDDKPYRRCGRGLSDTKNYSHLSRGHHVFKVFAVDTNGKRDPTPAKRGFHFTR